MGESQAPSLLSKSERMLREAEELGHTGSWEHDLVSGEIQSSDENRRLFFGDDPTKGADFSDYAAAVHPDDRERVLTSRVKVLENQRNGDIEYRIIWPDGSVHTIFARMRVIRDGDGQPIRAVGTNVDVTELRRAEAELKKKNEQLRALSRKVIEAQEAEREMIARELHDDLGQLLTAIKLNLESAARATSGLSQVTARIEDSIALVAGAVDRVRKVSLDLRPRALDDLGLVPALTSYLTQEARRGGFDLHIDFESIRNARLPPSLEIACFRLVQEAITNIQRHADARTVEVSIKRRNGAIEVIVLDDGKGFDVEKAGARRAVGESLGLLGLEERVSIAGGRLTIESSPGRGTAISAWLPEDASAG